MNENFWKEVFDLVEAFDKQRPTLNNTPRLYYNPDGTVIGVWESDYPDGENYIVLESYSIFNMYNTQLLRVVDNKLIVLENYKLNRVRLHKSNSGQQVVFGHAALPLFPNETFDQTEFYDYKSH